MDKEQPVIDPAAVLTPEQDKETDSIIEKQQQDDKDKEVTDNWTDELIRWRTKLMPYQRYIMIGGITILIFLVVFLGYASGGLKVCNDLDGVLDNKFKCHPNFEPETNDPFQLSANMTFIPKNASKQ